MTISEIFHPHQARTATAIDRLPVRGPIVVGYTGSPVSTRALETVLRAADAHVRISLVCAVTPIRPPRSTSFMHDALKSEAYLLSDRASIDEQLRRGVEALHAHSLEPETAVAIEGDPVRVLSRAARELEAAQVVVGMRDDRPTGQVRRIARALPDDVALFATSGDAHLRLVHTRRIRRGVRTLAPEPIGRAVGA
ncbi:universal stress protein [Gordonia hankookensis]|uniref:Universal stress protein n=1 Tax=Gordonia hankookensis TaxID=589403 RepID=A0ABR7WHM6_9ACTN|nr:universal stress protein [Gordonia hankookensis]MBD1322215.1 universal stress protein [Gordonia hankookensis]